ncbi:neuralized-like protein 4 [Ptychodera flava]|uniref:neuralized-like protein 4 n=1 Tax=Ptychodera flava TaxID=63121 RepID=UPI003969F228
MYFVVDDSDDDDEQQQHQDLSQYFQQACGFGGGAYYYEHRQAYGVEGQYRHVEQHRVMRGGGRHFEQHYVMRDHSPARFVSRPTVEFHVQHAPRRRELEFHVQQAPQISAIPQQPAITMIGYEPQEHRTLNVEVAGNTADTGSDSDSDSNSQRFLNRDHQPGCSYFRKCEKFMKSLDLGESCFSKVQSHRCYCKSCVHNRGDGKYYTRGRPPSKYALPIGWARFALDVPQHKLSGLRADRDWHVAFHGTTVDSVKPIIDSGILHMAGDITFGGHKLSERPGHYNDHMKPPGFNTKQIFVSPTIRYSGMDAYARPQRVRLHDGQQYKAKVAFQVWIRPGSYHVGRETVGAQGRIDSKFSNSEVEWSTQERTAIIPYGLLIKLK